jgi:hypothetical protein
MVRQPALINVSVSLAVWVILLAEAAFGAAESNQGRIEVTGGRCSVSFSTVNGSILAVTEAGTSLSVLRSSEQGLWHVRFVDGSETSATAFAPDPGKRQFIYKFDARANVLRMDFRAPEVLVTVTALGRPEGVELVGQITPSEKTVLDFALPGRLRFDPDQLDRFISPLHGHMGVGAAFKSSFFKSQPPDRPSSWQPQQFGPKGYAGLFGGPLDMRDIDAPPVKLTVTDEGRRRFGTALIKRINSAQASVNRPSRGTQVDLVLVDSPNGPYFAASTLGGRGLLWRLGGGVGRAETANAADLVMAVIQKVAKSLSGRQKLGLVNLTNGPTQGGMAQVAVQEWLDRFRRVAAAAKLELVELTSPEEMVAAAGREDFLVILNPYGEWLPVPQQGSVPATVEAIGKYVRGGGQWFEVGGYPFYFSLQPAKYLRYTNTYPPAFADFYHLESRAGSASIYRVQPRSWQPWEGAKDPSAIFVPGRLSFGGDEAGGYCERPYGTYVKAGQQWRSPAVRLSVGGSVADDLRAYCQANAITRLLKDKMPAPLLEKFKQAVLVKYQGNNQELIESLDKLPVPTLVHFTNYLKGGFDKEYPDHLPPAASYGTPEQFRAFFDRAHQLGHLMMPYTNPTWWCDHPRGPTFEREGEAPLLRTLDGKLSYERYNLNDGYTVCHWHPAVQAANRKTLRQFTDDYPVDILFQDQCGARGWKYDTNPASPTPYAYTEGMLSMIEEDCKTKPLSTEDAWDRVVNSEVQLCGLTFALVPSKRSPSWVRPMKNVYHPSTWEIFPVAQMIAHDKATFLHHDLGLFVTDRRSMSWTLGLGFCMSYAVRATALKESDQQEWLKWLDRVQKSICARYVGEPVAAFEHRRDPNAAPDDDGVIRAAYGPVRLAANLGPIARRELEHDLAPFGFFAAAPGMVAGNLKALGGMGFGEEGLSFVTEGDAKRADIWVFAGGDREVAVELPMAMSGEITVTLDGQPASGVKISGTTMRFRLPVSAANRLWHAQANETK